MNLDTAANGALTRLMFEYKSLQREAWLDIRVHEANLFQWTIGLAPVDERSSYYGGYFAAEMNFRPSEPYAAPTFRFLRPLYHPNIYADGTVCLLTLPPPGDQPRHGVGQVPAHEPCGPWLPVKSILRSVLRLLDAPDVNAHANVDAWIVYWHDRGAYERKVREDVEASLADIPAGFMMPPFRSAARPSGLACAHDVANGHGVVATDSGSGGTGPDDDDDAMDLCAPGAEGAGSTGEGDIEGLCLDLRDAMQLD